MNADDVVLIGSLVERCPSLRSILQEHLDDYDSLLPHVFMADVTRWVVEHYSIDPDDHGVACVLDILEASFRTGRTEDRELIAASFLENLPAPDDPGGGLRELIGPTLRDHIAHFG